MTAITETELVERVRDAVLAADKLELADAALHLNEALIALTGEGIAPVRITKLPVS